MRTFSQKNSFFSPLTRGDLKGDYSTPLFGDCLNGILYYHLVACSQFSEAARARAVVWDWRKAKLGEKAEGSHSGGAKACVRQGARV